MSEQHPADYENAIRELSEVREARESMRDDPREITIECAGIKRRIRADILILERETHTVPDFPFDRMEPTGRVTITITGLELEP